MSLLTFVIRRLLWLPALVLGVMLATFALLRGAGGSPFRPPPGYSGVPVAYENYLRDFYHLDDPWLVEFAYWVKNVFTFQFGPSLVQRNLQVDTIVEQRLPITLELVALAALWAVPVGVVLGVYAATHRNRVADRLATTTATVLLVVPVFFVAFVCSRYLVFEWHVVPGGWDSAEAKILPALVLGLAPAGYVARLVRASFVETMEEDYVRTARAKGLRRRRIVWAHVLRNSLGPMLAAAIPMLALLVTGAFFVEEAFRIPGASSFFVEAARTRDYPVLMNMTAALAVVVLLASLVADVLLVLLDPRIRDRTST